MHFVYRWIWFLDTWIVLLKGSSSDLALLFHAVGGLFGGRFYNNNNWSSTGQYILTFSP